MNEKIYLQDYDVVYISYDEPNADENWNDLRKKIPTAKRVEGIKGIASAHIAASKLSTTPKTITIDGDTRLISNILDHSFEITDPSYSENTLINWPSKNIINGLLYGNGGIKLWPTHILANRKSNELAPVNSPQSLDYCNQLHSQMTYHKFFSKTYINSSNLHAWRAGFREGIKLGLDRGKRTTDMQSIWQGGLKRLSVWMTVGADVLHGYWAMLGARQGFYYAHFTDLSLGVISDYGYLNRYFEINNAGMSEQDVIDECASLGNIISTKFEIPEPFTSSQSKFFKTFNINFENAPDTEYHWVKKAEWNV
jgi:hypothetical protein